MSAVAIRREPKRLQRRPHWRGMPIPANVRIRPDGTPDFADIDVAESIRLGEARLCALCGERMGWIVAFVGGEMAIANGGFNDGPMHRSCARYAFSACPHVSGSHRHYRGGDDNPEGALSSAVARRMGILLTDEYACVGGAFIAGAPLAIEWEDSDG